VLFFFEVLAIEGIDEFVGGLGPFGFLEVLDDAVGLERVGDGAAVFVGDAGGGAVGGHQGGVHFHLFFRVAISVLRQEKAKEEYGCGCGRRGS